VAKKLCVFTGILYPGTAKPLPLLLSSPISSESVRSPWRSRPFGLGLRRVELGLGGSSWPTRWHGCLRRSEEWRKSGRGRGDREDHEPASSAHALTASHLQKKQQKSAQ